MIRHGVVLVSLMAIAVPGAGCSGGGGRNQSGSAVSSLAIVEAKTPHFPSRRYDASGGYPQVRGDGLRLGAVNAALRRAIAADQGQFAPRARACARGTAASYRGVYTTSVARDLLSASTVVVSALLPSEQICPGGNEGHGWVAMTVRVPSGISVTLRDVVNDPSKALPMVVAAWTATVRRHDPDFFEHCIKNWPTYYVPTLSNVRYFALTPRGLALGFWQVPACERSVGIVPYTVMRPYLSRLGANLVAGVRRAR